MSEKRVVAWQGWSLQIPRRWDPVKLEGDHSAGHALFADTMRPRIGLRWQTPRKKQDNAVKLVQSALLAEVGSLAADEARNFGLQNGSWQSPLLYLEPEPPGRDVFSVYSPMSNRLLQVVYHANRRENLFAGSILPTLQDWPLERAAQWSIFDWNCIIPGGMNLKSQRLNAGDLGLAFSDRYHEMAVRQIAVAQLALQRQSLDGWIADQQKSSKRYHHPTSQFADTIITVNHREVPARISRMHKRLRYSLMWNLPKAFTTIAAHDADRDRLFILHGTDQSLLEVISETVGVLR